jgi:hypothetical protein
MTSVLFSSLNLSAAEARILLASVCKIHTRDQNSFFLIHSLPFDLGEHYESPLVEVNNQLPTFSTRRSALFPVSDSLTSIDTRFDPYLFELCTKANINTSLSVFERLALRGIDKKTAYYQICNKFNKLPVTYYFGMLTEKKDPYLAFQSVPRKYKYYRTEESYNLPHRRRPKIRNFRRIMMRFKLLFVNRLVHKYYPRKPIFRYLSKFVPKLKLGFKRKNQATPRLKLFAQVYPLMYRTFFLAQFHQFEFLRMKSRYTRSLNKHFHFMPKLLKNPVVGNLLWLKRDRKMHGIRTFLHAFKISLRNAYWVFKTQRLPFIFPKNMARTFLLSTVKNEKNLTHRLNFRYRKS